MPDVMKKCDGCGEMIPANADICPMCGKKQKMHLGSLTDEQIKRIKRPLTIIAWVAVLVVIYFKFFR